MDTNRKNIKFLSLTQKTYSSDTGKHEQISAARSFVASRMHARRRALDHSTGNQYRSDAKAWAHLASGTEPGNPEREVVLGQAHLDLDSKNTTTSPQMDEELPIDYLIQYLQSSEPDPSNILKSTEIFTSSTIDVAHIDHSQGVNHLHARNDSVAIQDDESRQSATRVVHNESKCEVEFDPRTSVEMTAGSQLVCAQYHHAAFRHHITGPDSTPPAIAEIRSVLDPFIRLPINVSAEEKSLIHFYLDVGRRWLLGTSPNPEHCPALELARLQLERSPMYGFSHIVIGELILSRMSNRPLRRCYYVRCADMYNAANQMLSDDSVPACSKLYVLIQMSMVEHLAQRIDLKAMHLRAIYSFIESAGGIDAVLAHGTSGELEIMLTRFYANQFVLSEVATEDYNRFLTLKREMLITLEIVQRRTAVLWEHFILKQGRRVSELAIDGCYELKPLTNYLHNLLSRWRGCETLSTAFLENSGVLCCSYSLAMTLVEHDPTPELAFKFLLLVQRCMSQSASLSSRAGKELDNIHSVAVTDIISYIRCKIFPSNRNNHEVQISQALVTSHRMCALLSSVRKIEMVAWVVDSILPMNPYNRRSTALDESYLKLLDEDLERAWWARSNSAQN